MTGQLANTVMDVIRRERVIGIIRSASADDAISAGRRLFAVGFGVVEVSLTTPGALRAIEQLVADGAGLVGVGTCLDEALTRSAIDAGASFAIAPTTAPEMVATARRSGIAAIPAAATPSEALACMTNGAHAVKLFPASLYGPAGLRAVAETLPQIPFVPTGGVTLGNALDWLAAGALALGMGGALLRASDADLHELIDNARMAAS